MVLPASAWPEKYGTVTNTDRMVQLGRRALSRRAMRARTSGSSRQMRASIGLQWPDYGDGNEAATAAVYDEMRQAMPRHRRHHLGPPAARVTA